MGIHDTMSSAEYHGDRNAISKSGLDLIHKSPAHLRYALDHPEERSETPAMQKGSLVHSLVLEPDKMAETYAVMPPTIKQRRGKEYEAFKASAGDRIIITADFKAEAQRIADAVLSNPVAHEIVQKAEYIEQSIFAEEFETGVLCKCRPDIRIGSHIYDLKTTSNAHQRSFSHSARNFRYHVQAAFYSDVCKWAGIEVEAFGFIAVDTQDMPYQCVVYHHMDTDAIQRGQAEYMDDLRRYAECLESGEWPGYPNEHEFLSLAGYAYDSMDLEAA